MLAPWPVCRPGAEGAAGVDRGERPDDGAGADGERQLALAGAPRRLADDARRLQVAALAEHDVGGDADDLRARLHRAPGAHGVR